MKRVWEEISLGFRKFGIDSTMLIDDYLYKCMGECAIFIHFAQDV
jgi:hypothetical protein